MKKFFKYALIILGIITIIFTALTIGTVMFFTGEDNFYTEVEGHWTTTQLDEPINFSIFKGSRAVKGFTYGYFDAINFDDYSYHIRYKDHSLEFVENDTEQFLQYSPQTGRLEGEIYLPGHSTKDLTTVILEKASD